MAYKFDGTEGAPIAHASFKNWVANFQATIGPNDIRAHFFGFRIISRILALPGCKGIRIYYGLDDQGKKQLLLVGTDSDGADLLPATDALMDTEPNIIGDVSFPCPPYCGK